MRRTTTFALALALGAFAAPALAEFDTTQMRKARDLAATCAEMEASLPRYGYEVSWLGDFLRRAEELGASDVQISLLRSHWYENEEQVRYSDADEAITPEEVASTRRTCTLRGDNIPR